MASPSAAALAQLRARLHDRYFVPVANPHGVSGASTVFHYRMEGASIWATYGGGRVVRGHVVARATGPDTLETLYHSHTTDGDLLAGWSRGRVGTDAAGRTTLDFTWGWIAGAEGGGESSYVEAPAPAAPGRDTLSHGGSGP